MQMLKKTLFLFFSVVLGLSTVSLWSAPARKSASPQQSGNEKLVESVELDQKPAEVDSANSLGIRVPLELEVAPPITEIGGYITPLFGLHSEVLWEQLQCSKMMPYIAVDIAFAGGKGDVKSYFHAGPGIGVLRPFSIRQNNQSFEVTPFVGTGLFWGNISKENESKGFVLSYNNWGVQGSWLIPNVGVLHSVDASFSYLHVFSQLPSGYLSFRLGVTLGF